MCHNVNENYLSLNKTEMSLEIVYQKLSNPKYKAAEYKNSGSIKKVEIYIIYIRRKKEKQSLKCNSQEVFQK